MTDNRNNNPSFIFPEIVIKAYRQGYFPMANHKYGDIYWHCPDPRAIIKLDNTKDLPRSLKQSIRKYNYKNTINKNFSFVIEKCSDRNETWISDEIIQTYTDLHEMGYAHSIETWFDGKIVGGLYGVSIGAAFFGESMFALKTDASKTAFFFLIEHLKRKNFILLDSQYINDFTRSLGTIEVPLDKYFVLLRRAINLPISFV